MTRFGPDAVVVYEFPDDQIGKANYERCYHRCDMVVLIDDNDQVTAVLKDRPGVSGRTPD
jgi:hypothetical protein